MTAIALFGALLMLLLTLAVGVGSNSNGSPTQPQGLPGVACAPAGWAPGQPVAGFKGEQLDNASAIVAAGVEMGAPRRAQVIAVATAMQESTLRNIAYGDRDSVGLFQQRTPWAPTAVRMQPKESAKLFYRRLLAIKGWEQLPLTVAAQRVQISAFPDAYAQWEAKANQVVGAVTGVVCPPAGTPGTPGGTPEMPDQLASAVIARATSQIGVPYAWGGGNANGPSRGTSVDAGKVGFDCSGLMVYAFAGSGITVPHQTQAIWAQFAPPITDRAQLRPGDMILLSSNGRPGGIHHVGLYLGDDRVLHAPESGTTVRIEDNIWQRPLWNREFIGAVRANAAASSRA